MALQRCVAALIGRLQSTLLYVCCSYVCCSLTSAHDTKLETRTDRKECQGSDLLAFTNRGGVFSKGVRLTHSLSFPRPGMERLSFSAATFFEFWVRIPAFI